MYSSRLYKYRDSYVLFIPTVHAFGSLKLTHTLLVQTHTHDVPPPWYRDLYWRLEYGIFSKYVSLCTTGVHDQQSDLCSQRYLRIPLVTKYKTFKIRPNS